MVERLRARCTADRLRITGDDMVGEGVAGVLLGYAPGTLRNWRSGARPLDFVRRSGQVLYALGTLAAWLENRQSADD